MNNRPRAITVICVLGFIGIAIGIFGVIALVSAGSMGVKVALPGWFLPWSIIDMIIGFVALVGMWQMKKWGVLLYTALAVLGQIIALATNTFSVLGLIIAVIIVAIALNNISAMD